MRDLSSLPVTFADIEAAAARIAPFVHRTPVLTSHRLNAILGCEVFFKGSASSGSSAASSARSAPFTATSLRAPTYSSACSAARPWSLRASAEPTNAASTIWWSVTPRHSRSKWKPPSCVIRAVQRASGSPWSSRRVTSASRAARSSRPISGSSAPPSASVSMMTGS